ncbi:MAG: hypothetical protein ACYCWE_09220 [Eubacteriales bacterium]
MNKLMLAFDKPSDLSSLILENLPGTKQVSLSGIGYETADYYNALAVLGGAEDAPPVLGGRARMVLEAFRAQGKPVFVEFIGSIGELYMGEPLRLVHHRFAYVGGDFIPDLTAGDIFDPHYNELIPYYGGEKDIKQLLCAHPYLNAHDRSKLPIDDLKRGENALWIINKSTLVCAFRLSSFRCARLAPLSNWQTVIKKIIAFLAGAGTEIHFPVPVCSHRRDTTDAEAAAAGLRWFHEAKMLVNGGADGVLEGFLHHIDAKDGSQKRTDVIRNDCTGETGGAFMLDWLLNGDAESKRIADACEDFIFGCLQIKDGIFAGMMRWSELAWRVCYQDDVARAIIPTLMRASLDPNPDARRHFGDACLALDFLVKTTGPDGLRVARSDNWTLDEEGLQRLGQTPGHPSAHYNSWYHAALLLAHMAGETNRQYLETAQQGLETLMNLFPDTVRVQTETQEATRLILPLALLYGVTKKQEHLDMLHRVRLELEKWRHESGGILEWDEGYKGESFAGKDCECSLLAENGDPVCDSIYANNWLLMGYAWAYYTTGDPVFAECYEKTAAFLRFAQIQSRDRLLNGGWTRAFDVKRGEIYGMPHDLGWAACCMETGWTTADIIMGFELRALLEPGKIKI